MRNTIENLEQELEIILDASKENPRREAFYRAFFAHIRKNFGTLSQSQIDGFKRLLFLWDKFPSLRDQPISYLSGCLAHIWIETGTRMQPVRETFASTSRQAVSILNSWWSSGKARSAGVRSRYWEFDGVGHPFGMGDIQITHRVNYVNADKMLLDSFDIETQLSNNYELALNPIVSGLIAFGGCTFGIFTGQKLSDFDKGNGEFDFADSRSIVNGDEKLVRADLDRDGRKEPMGYELEGIASVFLKALSLANEAASAPIHSDPVVDENLTLVIPEDQAEQIALIIKLVVQLLSKSSINLSQPVNKEVNTMQDQSKVFWKSKRFWGIAVTAASLFVPEIIPVAEIITPDLPTLPDEQLEIIKDGLGGIVNGTSNLGALLGMALSIYGSAVAKGGWSLK